MRACRNCKITGIVGYYYVQARGELDAPVTCVTSAALEYVDPCHPLENGF